MKRGNDLNGPKDLDFLLVDSPDVGPRAERAIEEAVRVEEPGQRPGLQSRSLGTLV